MWKAVENLVETFVRDYERYRADRLPVPMALAFSLPAWVYFLGVGLWTLLG